MAAAQHNLTRPVPPAGMAGRACPELSRRALLGAAFAPLILSGAEPGRSPVSKDAPLPAGMPDQVRHDESRPVTNWDRALARFQAADAALAAVAHTPDEELYDRLGARHDIALRRLLRTPAPDLPALAVKIDLALDDRAAEFVGDSADLKALKRDARRLAFGSS
jgi:hypothetical protein